MTTPALRTRLPTVGTLVFSRMSALAIEHSAVNLGQGFPDFRCDPALPDSRFRLLPADGSYSQCVRDATESGVVRFCDAKHDAMLQTALGRLVSR